MNDSGSAGVPPAGFSVSPNPPGSPEAQIAALIRELASTNLTRRTLALNDLCDVHGTAAIPAIKSALAAPANAFQKLNALWALHRLAALDEPALIAAMKDADPLVRTHALRIAGARRGDIPVALRPGGPPAPATGMSPLLEAIRAALADPDAITSRCAAETLAAQPAAENVAPLVALLRTTAPDDDHLIHATRIALRNQLRDPAVLADLSLDGKTPEVRKILLDLLRVASGEAAAEFRMKFFESEKDPSAVLLQKHLDTLAKNVAPARFESLISLTERTLVKNPEQLGEGVEVLFTALVQRELPADEPLLSLGTRVVTALLAPGEPQGEVRRMERAANLINDLSLPGFDPTLERIVTSASMDSGARAAAARAWLNGMPDAALPKIAGIVADPAAPDPAREQLARVLADAKSFDAITAAISIAPRRLQQSLAAVLASSREGGERLLAACADGKAPALLLRDKPLTDRLKAAKVRDFAKRIAKLTANLPDANAEIDKLIAARAKAFDPAKADAARGAEVFTRNCAVCHAIEGSGGALGPQLDGIGGRGPDRLLEDILDPNRNVDRAFRMNVITLKNGSVIGGLPRREEGAQLVLADAAGQETRVTKADIAERKETETSLMPPTFGEIIPAAELNDLLAFLLGKRATK